MAAKSPSSVRGREIIGVDQFSRRREVFDQHDTVFLPPQSPTLGTATETNYIIDSNHAKTTTNFKRNAPTYSSMKEPRTLNMSSVEFRQRKYSDDFTSEKNQPDDDYRSSMTERTRRLSKMRREFLKSNIHEPAPDTPFARNRTRASVPIKSTYKIESPNLYKFPFAEPYLTPTPVRKINFDSSEVDGTEKENNDPAEKHLSLPNNTTSTSAIDRQKLFEELLKRYSPPRKPINWTLPPTRPKVVGSVSKSASETTDYRNAEDKIEKSGDENVFYTKDDNKDNDFITNGDIEVDSKTSLSDSDEKKDRVPELSTLQRQTGKEPKKPLKTTVNDLNIPDLIQKITVDGENLEKHKETNKIKRKRSFLDKLLGRKKN